MPWLSKTRRFQCCIYHTRSAKEDEDRDLKITRKKKTISLFTDFAVWEQNNMGKKQQQQQQIKRGHFIPSDRLGTGIKVAKRNICTFELSRPCYQPKDTHFRSVHLSCFPAGVGHWQAGNVKQSVGLHCLVGHDSCSHKCVSKRS